MNIFYLSSRPLECAQWLGDRHLVKMPLETAQLLCTAHRVAGRVSDDVLDKVGMYKASYVNHPCAKWVRETAMNYDFAYTLLRDLCAEFRYRRGKSHKCEELLPHLVIIPGNVPGWAECKMWPDGRVCRTPPPLCMPDEFKVSSHPWICYRTYYVHKWQSGKVEYNWNRGMPDWLRRAVTGDHRRSRKRQRRRPLAAL